MQVTLSTSTQLQLQPQPQLERDRWNTTATTVVRLPHSVCRAEFCCVDCYYHYHYHRRCRLRHRFLHVGRSHPVHWGRSCRRVNALLRFSLYPEPWKLPRAEQVLLHAS